MNDNYDLKLGDELRSLTVETYLIQNIEGGQKIELHCSGGDSINFIIDSAVFSSDREHSKGIYISIDETGNVKTTSTLGKAMKYYEVKSLSEFVGTTICAIPKHGKSYLALYIKD